MTPWLVMSACVVAARGCISNNPSADGNLTAGHITSIAGVRPEKAHSQDSLSDYTYANIYVNMQYLTQ
jgi:hypothetical protein